MRKFLIVTLFVLSCMAELHAQTFGDVFIPEKKITWFGLDFSHAKFIGDENLQKEEDVQRFVQALNQLMLTESEKFNFRKALRKTEFFTSVVTTIEANKVYTAKDLSTIDDHFITPIKEQEIQETLEKFDYKDQNGMGLILNIDQFNKYTNTGSLWITFFDIGTKKIVYREYFKAKPQGFGVRNYWARIVYLAVTEIDHKRYKEWKSKYAVENN